MSKTDKFINKNYKISMEFVMRGDVPSKFTVEQLIDEIKERLSEVEISSELFDGEKEDYIWTLFPEYGDFDVKEFEYRFIENPSCEHCGDRHTDFGIEIFDGVEWCMSCGVSELPESIVKELIKEEKVARKKFLKNKIKSIKDELKNL